MRRQRTINDFRASEHLNADQTEVSIFPIQCFLEGH